MSSGKVRGKVVSVGGVVVRINRVQTRTGLVHRVDYHEGGRRVRRAFSDETEAKQFARITADRLAGPGAGVATLTREESLSWGRACAAAQRFGLSLDVAIDEWAEARRILGQGSLIVAARSYAAQSGSGADALPVPEAVERFLEAKRTGGRSAAHLNDLGLRLRRFAKSFPGALDQVEPKAVLDWVQAMRLAPRSSNNYLSAVASLARFARRQKWMRADALDLSQVDRFTVRPNEVEIFTPKEVAAILAVAKPEILPFLALGAFAGIRAAEIARLSWGQIHFKADDHCPHGWVEVKADQAKNAVKLRGRARRIVPMPANLAEWLRPLRGEPKDRVVPLARPIEAVARCLKAAGLEWKANGLRHSYGSYRMALLADENRVAYELGDSPKVIFAHYHRAVTATAAEQWFSVRPLS